MRKNLNVCILFFLLAFSFLTAQQHLNPDYIKITHERASKIMNSLPFSDFQDKELVIDIIAAQYRNLSKFHDGLDARIEILEKKQLSEKKRTKKVQRAKRKTAHSIQKLYADFLKELGCYLNDSEIDEVKNGMTYGVVPKTYAAFQEMLPNLTEEQKKFIFDNLIEAREHAMNSGTSKEKHAWFGKYKGRINNYLSSQGYDLNKESKAWHKRLEGSKNTNN